MPTEDKYGQELQRFFETQATTEHPMAVTDALKVVGCSRARAYQWLQHGARDVVEVDRNTRGAALFAYIPGSKGRLTVGPRGGGIMAPAGRNLAGMIVGDTRWLDVTPGQTMTVVSVRRTIDGGEVEVETADGVRLLVAIQ